MNKNTRFRKSVSRDSIDLRASFSDYFEIKPARTPALLEEAYRLRYQVYCLENAFENPSDYPDGLESDSFDDHSVHSVLLHRKTERIVGTVRLILPVLNGNTKPIPIQSICGCALPFPPETTAEVSRLAVSKEVRRRLTDGIYPDEKSPAPGAGRMSPERRLVPFIILGLINALVEMSAQHGITHWCTIMMPSLGRLLARIGIHLHPIGPMVEHHGKRQPCYRNLNDLLHQVKQEQPAVWDVLTRKGILWPPPH